MAVQTTLARERELAIHIPAAGRNGLSYQAIAEVLLHTAVYAGLPAGNAALAVAQARSSRNDASGGQRKLKSLRRGAGGAREPGLLAASAPRAPALEGSDT
jgi:carboxymuconolactone decarboxylase family protein